MIGLHIGKVAFGSVRNVVRAGLIAAVLALVSGGAAAIECPKGWVKQSIGPAGNQQEACRYCYECNIGTTPQTVQPRAPAKAVPGPCSAGLVARYMAQVSQQPPSRRPAAGSVVGLTENGKACVFKMPAAAAAPPPQSPQPPQQQQTTPAQPPVPPQRVVVLGRDGKYHIVTLTEAVAIGGGPPQFRAPSIAGEFDSFASTPLLIGPPMQSYAGELVFGPLSNAPPGYLTKLGLAYDWAEAKVAAQINWARENKAEAAIVALSMAVSFALPQLPAVAALSPLASTLVAGLTAPVVATTTTTFINTLMRTGRTGTAMVQAGKDAGLVVLNGVPSAVGGESFKTVSSTVGAPQLVTSIAEHAGSYAGDLAAQYAPAVLSQSVPAERTVSYIPNLQP